MEYFGTGAEHEEPWKPEFTFEQLDDGAMDLLGQQSDLR